ncbi:isopeptide-forming domain-containing fimbrial protein [Collinsella aerofaciens]|uniref:isopeptide-forming domain-containing fimbrial protein n=1 Tax=Collinsella aerofaciens TaxID=74426 RepID=UPI003D7A9EED
MSKNIARLAVTAGLTAALSFGGVMAPVTMAFADGATGSITISQAEKNDGTTFKAYQIFKATVTDVENGGKTAQNITWASETVGPKVINAINSWENDHSLKAEDKLPNKPTPQEVADFITAHAGDCTAGSESTKGTRIATDNILYAVANAVKNETPVNSDIVAGTPWAPDDENGSGYYLFLTNGDSLGAGKKNTGTSPIFAVVGGKAVTVTEKTSIPTVNKQILAATSADPTKLETGWAGVANSQIGQEVTYKLTGKVADNYATYDSYAYKFTDTLSNGLDYVSGSLKVYAVNNGTYTLINNGYELTAPTEDNRVLTVNFAVDKATSKKGLKDIDSVNADTEIVVFYKAKLNKNAVTGNGTEGKKGNYNAVKLEYSNNPSTEGTGTSVESGAGDFTFKLNLNKVDQGTEKGLKGAEFSIQSADADTLNQYVASKNSPDGKVVAGQLVNSSDKDLPDYLKFSSDDKGKIEVKGLDAGSYKVTEIKAPSEKYTVANPFTFTITAEYKKDAAELEKITVSPSQNDERRSDVVLGTLDNTPGDNTLTVTNNSAANVQTGEVNITIGNTKQVGLPLTGLNGVTFTWIAGGAVLCIGVAHLIRSRKQAEESEQE